MSDFALTIRVSGYSHRAPMLADTVIRSLLSASDDAFYDLPSVAMQLHDLKQSYENSLIKCSSLATSSRLLALKPSKVGAEEKLRSLEEYNNLESRVKKVVKNNESSKKKAKTIASLNSRESGSVSAYNLAAIISDSQSLMQLFQKSLCLDVLVEGNLHRQTALELCKSVDSLAASSQSGISTSNFPAQPILKLSPLRILILQQVPRSLKDKNVCIEVSKNHFDETINHFILKRFLFSTRCIFKVANMVRI